MEESYEIFEYLPLLYQDESEREYVETLFKAFQLSYENKLYQFAYLQYHMIFMVCIYFLILKIVQAYPRQFEDAIFYLLKDRAKDLRSKNNTKQITVYQEGKPIEANALYFGSFAAIGESDVLRLLQIIGVDSDLLGELKYQVEERNKYAHANGNMIITSEKTISEKISKYLNLVERVSKIAKEMILGLYTRQLSDKTFVDPEEREYVDDDMQIKEMLVRNYSLCKKDLNYCRKYDIATLESLAWYDMSKKLHIETGNYYKSCD